MTKSLLPARLIRSAASKVGCLALSAGYVRVRMVAQEAHVESRAPVMMHDRDVS